MEKTVKCRVISQGKAQADGRHIACGEALISQKPIGFNFSVDVPTGKSSARGHELEGISIKDKVLIFPDGKGSTGGSYVVYQVACEGTGPAAIINLNTEVIIACGAIMGGIPVVDHMEEDPYDIIQNGDWVEVDTDTGVVTIKKKEA